MIKKQEKDKPFKENRKNALLIREMGEKIKKSEQLLKDLLEDGFMGSFRSDSDGNIIMANKILSQFFGFSSPKDFLNSVKNIDELYINTEDLRWILSELKSKGFVDSIATQVRLRSGGKAWVNVKGMINEPLKNSFEFFITDIRKFRRENESGISEDKTYPKYVDTASDFCLVLDRNARILDINRQACSKLGYTKKELCGMVMFDLDMELQKEEYQIAPRDFSYEKGQFITFESSFKCKDGSIFPAQVRFGRLSIGSQEIFISLISDITERQKAENKLLRALEDIKKMQHILEKENFQLREKIETYHKNEEIIGKSTEIRNVLRNAEKVAGGDTCVLITGETGTGKELVAKAIHDMSSRKDREIVKVNCAALPATLIESELFGREKGAFTGSVNKQIGRFEAANGSTIFLDEIGDLPLELQSKLLRVLQDGKFERLGSTKTISVDVRVIAATNHNLLKLVQENRFRQDLFYRLNVFPITVPPLRERRDDIPILVWAFVEEFSQSLGKYIKAISPQDMERLKNNYWPGNVRELKNTIERAMILASATSLNFDWLDMTSSSPSQRPKLEDVERSHILSALEDTGWRIRGSKGASELLGIKPTTLESRMKKLGIKRRK